MEEKLCTKCFNYTRCIILNYKGIRNRVNNINIWNANVMLFFLTFFLELKQTGPFSDDRRSGSERSDFWCFDASSTMNKKK